jgi:myosin-1
MSPLSQDWPECNPLFKEASSQLKEIYHHWRCRVYRKPFLSDAAKKVQYVEKLQASQTFKGKKSSYSESVAVPFKGDYIGLSRDEAWNQLATSLNDRQVVWADLVNKINRADGKAREKMLVITKLSFLILDPKTMKPLYRVPLSELQKVSVSKLSDDFFIFHIAGKPTDHALRKGDYIFQNHHVIELVTKTARTVSQVNNRNLPVMVANRVEANLMNKVVEIEFDSSPQPIPRPICRRKGQRLEVSV